MLGIGGGLAVMLVLLALAWSTADARASGGAGAGGVVNAAGDIPTSGARPTVVIAFDPGGGRPARGQVRPDTVFERLAARPQLALGFMGATQGAYTRRQTLLDLTAGNRVSASGYEPRAVPRYRPRPGPGGWRIDAWAQVVERAATAPTRIVPGRLAASVPGGAAYLGTTSRPSFEAVVAAGVDGRIAAVSLGSAGSLPQRIDVHLRRRQLAVVALPAGERGQRALDQLLRHRPGDRLVLVIRRPPSSETAQMLPFGVAGLPRGGRLTSATTRLPGLVATTDALPTALAWLRRPVPADISGRPIVARGTRDVAALRGLEQRLRVVYPRRFPALYAIFAALTLTGLALAAFGGAGGHCRALRVCALAVFWIPAMSLACAALEPTRAIELLLMSLGTVILGLLCDAMIPWPRAPALPALLGVVAYVIDLARGSDLVVRSLLGPNPRFGSRFYGIGNELEATLPVLLLVGLAAAVGAAPRSRRLATGFGLAMLMLGVAVGAGRLGADVGGVITVGAAGAGAVVVLRPGRITRRGLLLALAVPALALIALAVIDTLSGGDAHFTRTVLRAEDPAALGQTILRRYELAWQSLSRGLMPLVTLVAILAAAVAWRRRRLLYAPVAGRPAWAAALVGGLAGSVAGALTNDSGPVLLVIGVFVLAWATAYVRGDPRLVTEAAPPEP